MKKILLLAAVLLGAYATMHAQDKKKRPVTEKPKQETPSIKSEPTAQGQANRQRAEEEIRKSRAEKRAKMEETKKSVKEKIATDTTGTKR